MWEFREPQMKRLRFVTLGALGIAAFLSPVIARAQTIAEDEPAPAAPAPAAPAPATPAPAAPAPAGQSSAVGEPEPGSSLDVRGFHALAFAGYGASTNKVRHVELAPYGASFGVKAGYTFAPGAHLGAYFDYSLGRSIRQTRDPLLGRPSDFTADTSSLSGGLVLAWDVPLYFLVLRSELDLGFTSMSWEFKDWTEEPRVYLTAKNPSTGFHFAPGATLLWPHGRFEAGLGFNYVAQANGAIPSGFLGQLLAGVKL